MCMQMHKWQHQDLKAVKVCWELQVWSMSFSNATVAIFRLLFYKSKPMLITVFRLKLLNTCTSKAIWATSDTSPNMSSFSALHLAMATTAWMAENMNKVFKWEGFDGDNVPCSSFPSSIASLKSKKWQNGDSRSCFFACWIASAAYLRINALHFWGKRTQQQCLPVHTPEVGCNRLLCCAIRCRVIR